MKYKEQVADRIESAIQKIDVIKNGYNSRTLTIEEVFGTNGLLDQARALLVSVTELVELE